jgi:hypothetical protein
MGERGGPFKVTQITPWARQRASLRQRFATSARSRMKEATKWGGLFGQIAMAIPHWLISLGIFAVLGAFIAFAFRQGQRVKPDRNKDPNDWTRLTGGGGDHTGI